MENYGQNRKKKAAPIEKRAKNNLVAFNADNDIKYRAPFGINHVRTLAWICIIVMQITVLADVVKHFSDKE